MTRGTISKNGIEITDDDWAMPPAIKLTDCTLTDDFGNEFVYNDQTKLFDIPVDEPHYPEGYTPMVYADYSGSLIKNILVKLFWLGVIIACAWILFS